MNPYQKHVLVCSKKKAEGIPNCHSVGGMDLADSIRAALYKKGLENQFPVTTTGCLGLCMKGPVVVVYPEGKWYTSFKNEEIDTLIDSHLLENRPLDREGDPTPGELEKAISEHLGWDKKRLEEKGKL